MRIEICQSYEALSLKAKEIVTSELGQHKALTLCAATGGSPTRMYELLVEEAGRQPDGPSGHVRGVATELFRRSASNPGRPVYSVPKRSGEP